MALHNFVDWDTKKEKILIEFSDISELEKLIKEILDLKNSEIYQRVYETSKDKEGKLRDEPIHDLLKLSQVKYATKILKDPPLYLPPLTDVIISSHFIATVSIIDFILCAYKQEKLSQKDLNKNHMLLEKLMSLLNSFDDIKDYKAPDKEFYQKLKEIKN